MTNKKSQLKNEITIFLSSDRINKISLKIFLNFPTLEKILEKLTIFDNFFKGGKVKKMFMFLDLLS